MHLMAWYLPSFTFCALSTSEKVPSPFLATSRYFLMAARPTWTAHDDWLLLR